MAFSATRVKSDIQGTTKVEYWSWDAASVTTGAIDSGIANIMHISGNNSTTEGQGLWTNESNVVTVAGLSSSDVGTVKIEGF